MINQNEVGITVQVARGFLENPDTTPDPRLVRKAIEWHDNVTAGYKLVRRSTDKEIVDMYLTFNKSC